jgi:1,2-diacylglycerol 3-beta-galactosyltransferase
MTHIIFMMSDTGGGHRAAARAIEAALQEHHANQFTSELVDLWKDYMPFPLNRMPKFYPRWVNQSPTSYAAQYWVQDRMMLRRSASRLYCNQMYPRMKRFYVDHPADIYVCVHSVFVRPGIDTLRRLRLNKPFITVITDYAWPPAVWYDTRVDKCLVPTEPAYKRGLRLGMPPDRMILTGAPVHPKFTHVTISREEARRELGWDMHSPVILLVGGGDGMGRLLATARAIDEQPIDAHIAIIAGRNQNMKKAMEAVEWKHPTHIYGFVNNMQVHRQFW